MEHMKYIMWWWISLLKHQLSNKTIRVKRSIWMEENPCFVCGCAWCPRCTLRISPSTISSRPMLLPTRSPKNWERHVVSLRERAHMLNNINRHLVGLTRAGGNQRSTSDTAPVCTCQHAVACPLQSLHWARDFCIQGTVQDHQQVWWLFVVKMSFLFLI